MSRKIMGLIGILGIIALYGCDTALVVGNRTVGMESGRFYYTDGVLKTDYSYGFDQVWTATGKVLRDLKAADLQERKKIAKGTVDCLISDEKVHIDVEYGAKNMTYVFVRAGVAGNQLAARMLLDRIKATLESGQTVQ